MTRQRRLARTLERGLGLSRPLLRALARPGYFDAAPSGPPRRVLLLAGHWLGDTFWATQIVRPLQAFLGAEAQVWVATKSRARGLWEGLVPPERVLVLRHLVSDRRREPFAWRGFLGEAARLRALRCDLILDAMGNRYSALLSFLARPQRALGCERNELDRLYSSRPAPFPPGEHLALRPWHVLAAARGESPPTSIELQPASLHASAEQALAPLGLEPGGAFAVLAPGAGWESKRWPAERFAELAALLAGEGLTPLALGGEHERALLERVVAGCPSGRALPGLDLLSTSLLLARARLVVSNDSALGHLAAAEGTPVVSLFNSTNPRICRPLGERVRVLRSGCAHEPSGDVLHCHGRPEHACPPSCWDGSSVARVFAACRRELA